MERQAPAALLRMRKGESCRSPEENLGGSAWNWARFRGLSEKDPKRRLRQEMSNEMKYCTLLYV